MRHLLYISLLLVIAQISRGQTSIKVLDDAERLPLQGAHVIYTDVNGENQGAVLTDPKGFANIPDAFAAANPRMVVNVSYIGFKKITDTISRGDQMTYRLEFENQNLNEVVVTAQYAANSPDKAVHKIRIIDEKKIERMAAVSLEDVLMNETNIRISQDGVLGSQISMQGISGQNVKIMIDGVPVIGRQDGNIDLNQINLNDVERIEIVEGPLSVNYGSDALAGTINIITKKQSREKTSVGVTSYNETIGTYNLTASTAQQVKDARFAVSGGRNFFNGWSPNDPVEPNGEQPVADSTRTKSWNPKEQYFGRAQLNYRWKDLAFGYKFEYFDELVINRGRPRAPYNESAFDDYYHTSRIDHALTAAGKVSRSTSLNFVAAYNRFEREKNTYVKDLTTLQQQLTTTPGDQDTSGFDLWMNRGSVAIAPDSSRIGFEVGYDVSYESGSGQRIEAIQQSMGNYAVFATAELAAFSNFTVRPGLRYSYNTVYDAPITPSVNVRYQIKNWALRASYAQGFRAPSIKELYFNFVDINHNIVGNTDLKAEYSNNYTLSAKYKRIIKQTIFQWELGGYYNDIKNMITLGVVDAAALQYSYINIGNAQTQGINTSTSFMFEHLKVNLGAAYIGIRNELDNDFNRNQFNYYPELTSALTYDWKKPQIIAALFYKYQGRKPNTAIDENDQLYTTFIEDYHTLDFNLSKPLFEKRLSASIGVKNVFDVQNVASTAGGGGGTHSTSAASVPVSAGRLYFLRLDFNFKR